MEILEADRRPTRKNNAWLWALEMKVVLIIQLENKLDLRYQLFGELLFSSIWLLRY